MVQCRQGQKFLSDYRVADDSQSNVFGWKWANKTIATNTACVDSKSDEDGSNDETVNYGYFPISYDVKNGDEVTFSLGDSGTQYGNTLFLCGFQTKKITPNHWYVNPNEKNLNGAWDVRNSNFYDTKIPLKEKDYLRFAYGGKVFGHYDGQNIDNKFSYISNSLYSRLKFYYDPQRADLALSLNGQCSDDQDYFPGDQMSTCYYNADQQKSYCITKDNKTIEYKNGSCGNLSYDNMQDKRKMCSLRSIRNTYVKKNVDINGFSVNNMPLDKFEFSGYLNNYKSNDDTLKIRYKDDYILTTQCTPKRENEGEQCVDWDHWPNCGVLHGSCCVIKVPIYKYTKDCSYFIDGKYYQSKSFGSNESEYNQGYTSFDQTIARSFSKNFGGYEVEINWKGYPHKDGKGLQYAVVPVGTDSKYEPWNSNVKWMDAYEYIYGDNSNKEIEIKGDGRIFFRIDPSMITKGRENTLGAYGVIVNKKDTPSDNISGIISDVLNTVTKFFIGEDGNQSNSGKVQYIFNKITQDTVIVNGIRALLVLYLVYTGISFMIGFVKITQKEAMNRVLKIAFVVMIISPNSWVFFNTYLLSPLGV
jgi:hypothetical protein